MQGGSIYIYIYIYFLYGSLHPRFTRAGLVVQLVASPTADPGVASLISLRVHTFMEIDHEIIYTSFFSFR